MSSNLKTEENIDPDNYKSFLHLKKHPDCTGHCVRKDGYLILNTVINNLFPNNPTRYDEYNTKRVVIENGTRIIPLTNYCILSKTHHKNPRNFFDCVDDKIVNVGCQNKNCQFFSKSMDTSNSEVKIVMNITNSDITNPLLRDIIKNSIGHAYTAYDIIRRLNMAFLRMEQGYALTAADMK